MIDSLFDKNTIKKYDELAKKQAKLNARKETLAKSSLEKLEPETLINVFDIVEQYGHPNEKQLSEKLRNKYNSGTALEFDDLLTLDNLYKSNVGKFSNKDVQNE